MRRVALRAHVQLNSTIDFSSLSWNIFPTFSLHTFIIENNRCFLSIAVHPSNDNTSAKLKLRRHSPQMDPQSQGMPPPNYGYPPQQQQSDQYGGYYGDPNQFQQHQLPPDPYSSPPAGAGALPQFSQHFTAAFNNP